MDKMRGKKPAGSTCFLSMLIGLESFTGLADVGTINAVRANNTNTFAKQKWLVSESGMLEPRIFDDLLPDAS